MPTYVGDALMAHAQAGCYRCRRGDRLVDTDVQIVGEGALALCVPCISDLAEVAGLTFNAARVQELETELAAERTARARAEVIEEHLENALQSVKMREAHTRPPVPQTVSLEKVPA